MFSKKFVPIALLSVLASVGTIPSSASAADEDLIDNDPPPAAVSMPDEPGADAVCENYGWKFQVTSWRNRFQAKEPFSETNRTGQTQTMIVSATKKASTEYAVSAGVSVSAGSAMFGEVQANVNVEVRKSMEYGLTFGTEVKVPPHTETTVKLGFKRTIAEGKSYYLTQDGCRKTNVKRATIKAPWKTAYVVTNRRL